MQTDYRSNIMDEQYIKSAALKAVEAYTDCKPSENVYVRKVEQFRPFGSLAAVVTIDSLRKDAYVAFRGTKLSGNWLFTNLQATSPHY